MDILYIIYDAIFSMQKITPQSHLHLLITAGPGDEAQVIRLLLRFFPLGLRSDPPRPEPGDRSHDGDTMAMGKSGGIFCSCHCQLIGLMENLQENPIFHGKIYGFL